jgi:hypothetical protein
VISAAASSVAAITTTSDAFPCSWSHRAARSTRAPAEADRTT